MAPPIGFVIVTHRDPPQTVRLASRLQDVFGPDAPIVVHHDFDQCQFDAAVLPEGVRVVRPHHRTGWGCWGWIEAVLASLRLLRDEGGGPDYSVVMSGQDYPVAPAERVLGDLRGIGADAYLHSSVVSPWRRDRKAVRGPLGFAVNEGAGNQKATYRRYYRTTYYPFGIRVNFRNPLFAPLLAPFKKGFRCWAGEPWWTVGRRGVDALLEFGETRPDVRRWFEIRREPEEAYPHTALRNTPGLAIHPRHFRYVDWNTTRPNPRVLGVEDVPRVLASGAHFARKFAPDSPALDALDAALGLPAWRGPGSTSRAGSL